MKLSKLNSLALFIAAGLISLASCTGQNEKSPSESSSLKAPSISIHEAAFMGNVEALKQHVEAKTDLNQKDQYGSSPLAITATFGKNEAAKVLINGGADLNATSGDGSTALHTAAFFGRTEIVEALLSAGANRNIKNNYGSTPLESVSGPFENVKPIYDQLSKDLGPFGLKFDYDQLKKTRPIIAKMLAENL